jgi:hypothetical protein
MKGYRRPPGGQVGFPGRKGTEPGPPRIVEWFLQRLLPSGTTGDSIIGDLREEFAMELKKVRLGKARLQYLRKALSITTRFVIPSSSDPSPGSDRHNDKASTMSALWHDIRQAHYRLRKTHSHRHVEDLLCKLHSAFHLRGTASQYDACSNNVLEIAAP